MAEKEKEKSKLSSKKKKLIVLVIGIVVIIIAIFVVLISIEPPSPYLEVNDLMASSSKYTNEEVEVVGTVGEIEESGNGSLEITFELLDRDDSDKVIYVRTVTQPDGFVSGKDVVVTGTLENENGNYVIKAKSIKVGCPSKYE